MITQLIINGVEYPFTSRGKYRAYKEPLGKSIRMASGRLVTEEGPEIWKIEYSYDYMGNEIMRRCLEDLRGHADLNVTFLIPDSDDMITAQFRCTQWPAPSVPFKRGDEVFWNNVNFKLEALEGS